MTKSTDSSSHGADGDARSRDPSEDRIRAEIAGTVLRIKIAVGDQVADGDVVAVLESMKMEIPVVAEVAGTVVSLYRAVLDDGD